MEIQLLDATFGAVVHGLKLADLSDSEWAELYRAWLDRALLIFPDQHLRRDQQIAFAKRFGPLEFEIAPISNVRKDGSLRDEAENDDVMKILKGNMGWHADSTYMPLQAKGAVFSAEVVPTIGGHTGFADMRAAYDSLDPVTREQVDQLSAFHSLYYSQSKLDQLVATPGQVGEYSGYGFHDGPVPLRPLVKIHPETGRKSLIIGRHAHNIPGMSEAESEQFLDALVEFACQPPRTYHHDWKVGDTVVWDNRCLLHRATPWDMNQPRVMWHSRLAGDPLSEAGTQTPKAGANQ
jgi:alpha-ketoglutarate-dependent taurine dioxygenase